MGSWRVRAALGLLGATVVAVAILVLGGSGESSNGQGEGREDDGEAAARGPAGRLSDDELIEQVLLLGFDGATPDAATAALAERQLGGVLVGAANWPDPRTGSRMVAALREAGRADDRIPPLIATSQEGGPYNALTGMPPPETALQIADAGSLEAAEEWSERTSTALRVAGIDLNLFPVADVATLDSAVADRSFSDDPAVAAQFTAAAVRGCRTAEIACAAAHFPGLGAASQDTNQGPATVGLDPAALSARDLEPFRAAFDQRVPAVVLSLALYASYDSITPGALTESVATGLLRDELGFEGVAITDDLGAGAVRAVSTVPEAAVEALNAGSDLLQIGSPADQDGVERAIERALADETLPRERLLEAAGRVLELKRKLGLLDE
jgi:beta-N-acetylhexosaminidase